ncbi:hypothetical protein HPP92_026656 [Vanilla planifolia]|uniref:Protein kinase domain-containing protein n=1 Tax=Vanilla planifolia TaxID=51239 RepID=A0A835PEM7_VANPL|nr:hypothetical protein HPP92_026656 [Vanilla planifolia]
MLSPKRHDVVSELRGRSSEAWSPAISLFLDGDRGRAEMYGSQEGAVFGRGGAGCAVSFSFKDLAAATQWFKEVNLFGEGGFGKVYKGRLESGQASHSLGAAQGLAYLHDVANPPVIYRDMKAANVLLDNDFNPKLSDFGLAKIGPVGDNTHVSTRVMGTYGYCAPDYAMSGKLTLKSDIYSFGCFF